MFHILSYDAGKENKLLEHLMSDQWEYQVLVYREGFWGSVIFGASKVDPEKFSAFLNRHGSEGWEVATMERDIRRQFLFFKVDSYAVIMKRKKV